VIARFAAFCLLAAALPTAAAEVFPYELRYDLTLKPGSDRAEIVLTLGEGAQHVRWMRFSVDPERQQGFDADGELESDGEHLTWTPPDGGGQLKYTATVSHRRAGGRFDARMTDDWALFRGDDLFPSARLRQEAGAEAEAELHVYLPQGWSFVAPYERLRPGVYRIENPARGFDRPTGWIAAGRLGVRRERIARVHVAVAGPLNQGVRRLDVLAFLNWNLPRLRALVDEMPERLLLVSAGDEMWRGGLSGPDSLYLHADRPLLSENGTSTLMHELVHVVTGLAATDGNDWIVEGLAEYYALKVMWRSGTISERRYKSAFEDLEDWGGDLELADLAVERSRGPVTARAVGILRAVDLEIHRETDGEHSLDEVLRHLVAAGKKVDLAGLRKAVQAAMGSPAKSLGDVPSGS
jgi:hypothetical protein